MGKGNYIRTVRAGRYVAQVQYTRALPGDSPAARRAKTAVATQAQHFLNVKNATEKLERLLYANFDSKDSYFCTFTFSDPKLPLTLKDVKKAFVAYIAKLRKEWKRTGRELKYIYTIEGEPNEKCSPAAPVSGSTWETEPWKVTDRWEKLDSPGQERAESPVRFHIHCFLRLQKSDYDTVRSLWDLGHVHINKMKVNEITTFSRLASYVTKEYRTGEKSVGARSYVPSLNLAQPEITGCWCEDGITIEPPDGAEVIRSGREDMIYTSYKYLVYRLPRPQQLPAPYVRKGSIQKKKSRL